MIKAFLTKQTTRILSCLLCTATLLSSQIAFANYHPLAQPMYDPLSEDLCAGTGGSSVIATGPWDPLTLKFPAIPSEEQVIAGMKSYIQTNYPNSPFAKNIQYVDQIFTLSKQRDVNPLLVMAIAKQENGFGQAASSATANNNYFGITQGNGYRSFGSVEEGIDYFVEKVGRHVTNPTGAYEGLTNFYEYLSIHQVGLIAYPGEYPDGAPGRNATPPYLTFDERMNVYTSWDKTRNSHKEGSPMYNPGIYYKNSVALINEVTGMTLPDTPSKAPAGEGGGSSSGCSAQQAGRVNAQGYAFPLAPQTRIGYGDDLPCDIAIGCHHDDTAAFDLSYEGVAGKSVYAIVGGKIDKVNTQEPGWCQSIQLHGTDGYFYWYGHVIDVKVVDGQAVTAGQEIAKVADWTEEHTCAGTSFGDHLHIDRGCTIEGTPQRGGGDDCRDPGFIQLLNEIYNGLPPG